MIIVKAPPQYKSPLYTCQPNFKTKYFGWTQKLKDINHYLNLKI